MFPDFRIIFNIIFTKYYSIRIRPALRGGADKSLTLYGKQQATD
jgi:hypothetical protein